MAERVVKFEGASAYRSPLCNELAGKTFYLVMDDGNEYLINFLTGNVAIWGSRGEEMKWNKYECLKADETTYFVIAEMVGFPLRTGIVLVLDTEQSLVTMQIAHHGENPKFPYMVTNKLIFGAIKVDGEPLPRKRHGYTTDMVGKRITWNYGANVSVTHMYVNPRYYRVFPNSERTRAMSQEEVIKMMQFFGDEPSQYVKIKENLYFFTFIEESFTRAGRTGNNMTFVIDTARVHDVGRSFGLNGDGEPENYLFCAIGEWQESDGVIESLPSPYHL